MAAARKFDHAEAKRLRDEGLPVRVIAERLGVTTTAVYLVTVPEYRAKNRARHDAWQRSGECPDCGAPTTRYRASESRYCIPCASKRKATSAKETVLRCTTCGEWKPDDSFPSSRPDRYARRGRHSQCRSCQTVARQNYRERHKVPCESCGEPCLPPSEKGTSGTDFARCRACYLIEVAA